MKNKAKNTGIVTIFLSIVLLMSSCLTTQENSRESAKKAGTNPFEAAFENLEPKEQSLSESEQNDIALWQATDQKIFIQNHIVPSEQNPTHPYNPWLASYEGFRMASLLGFDADFSTDEMYTFIRAMFDDMPGDVTMGNLVKSIVVSDWYEDGSPLVINITRAFSRNKIPVAVYMFNTWDNLRNYGLPLIKKAGVAFEYPRLKTPEGDFRQEFMDSYSISWMENGLVSASSSAGQEAPGFSTASDDFGKVNLSDDWLRDGNLDNDAEVLVVLNDIIQRDEIKPIGKVFARMQLFMFHLFHGDVKSAQFVIDELNESGLLESPEVSGTEVGTLAKRDLQRILDIAVRLSES